MKGPVGPRIVTLAVGGGRSQHTAVTATLVTRAWDSETSYFTLDLNGERFIVNPFGARYLSSNRAGTQHRTGHGSGYENIPVAFGFIDDTQDPPQSRKDFKDDLGSNLEEMSSKTRGAVVTEAQEQQWRQPGMDSDLRLITGPRQLHSSQPSVQLQPLTFPKSLLESAPPTTPSQTIAL